MKIICDCGNEVNIIVNNKNESLRIDNDNYDDFCFWGYYGEDYENEAGIHCEKCGREIRWH